MFLTCQDIFRWAHKWASNNPEQRVQRLGQSFCNHFNVTDPELFYEANNRAALKLIYERYAEKQVERDAYKVT